jgi:hypothetical protein
MQKKIYFYISSGIFFIVGLIHFLKILIGFEIQIFGTPYPILLSWFEMIVAFYLSFIGFKFGKKNELKGNR